MPPTNLHDKSVPGKPLPAKRASKRWVHEIEVVGLGFRMKKDARRALAGIAKKRKAGIAGMAIEREPANAFDENALKVCLPGSILDGVHIGYLRATTAALLAPKIDAGRLVIKRANLTILFEEDEYKEGAMLVTFEDIAK